MIKLKEEGSIADSLARVHDHRRSISYADQLMELNQRKNPSIEIKTVMAEEVRIDIKVETPGLFDEEWEEEEARLLEEEKEDSDLESFDSAEERN